MLEILSFYDGVELYLSPNNHDDLFTSKTKQVNIEKIYSFACSKKLEENKTEISVALSKPHAFERESLHQYLEDLAKIFEEIDVVAPIMLLGSNHTVSLRYNRKNKKWLYVDTNDFVRYPKEETYIRELDNDSLADSIFRSFFCEGHPYTVFNTILLTKSSQ